MKVKKNNRFLTVSISIVIIVVIILVAILVLTNSDAGRISTGFMGISDKISSDLSSDVDVTHYNIDIELIAQEKRIVGDIEIMLNLPESNHDKITLDFYDNFDINTVQLNGYNVEYTYHDNLISIDKREFKNGLNKIRIKYEGTPESKGLGSFDFGTYNDKSFVYSLSEPVFASTWFPCNDVMTDKATLDISLTNDSSMVSVSNGRLISIKTNGAKRTYSYTSDYPIATYLIAIYSADYDTFSDKYISLDGTDTMSINYYVTPDKFSDAKIDFSIHPEALKILSELFGEYPFIHDGYGVAQFLWRMGAMEHQTITGIGTDFISGYKFYTSMLVHEAAHHWWGNAVTPKTWKDIWLNEGFATYSEALYWEKKTGKRSLKSTMAGFFNSFDQGRLYNPGINMFSRLVYEKGAWVLHMLRREVGDSAFFNTLRNYFKKYKYKNASTDDFINLCEAESGKDLDYFFDQWVYKGIGIPEIDYSVNYVNKNAKVHLTQVQKDKMLYKFPLDIKMMADNNESETVTYRISSRDTVLSIPFDQKPDQVILDPEGWLLASVFENIDEK